MSRSVVTMSRTGLFGSGLLSRSTHKYIPCRSVCSAMVIIVCLSRLDGATDHASCPIQLSKLGDTLLQRWIICASHAGLLVSTTLSASWSPRRRGCGCAGGLRCWSVCQLQISNFSCDGFLASWHCVSRFVIARSKRGGFLLLCDLVRARPALGSAPRPGARLRTPREEARPV